MGAGHFVDREPVQHVATNVLLPVLFREQLRYLSAVTRVSQAEYLREAVSDLLDKYRHVLGGGGTEARPKAPG